jgi:hypothetical protein
MDKFSQIGINAVGPFGVPKNPGKPGIASLFRSYFILT